jgi:hypothetical protein
LLRLGLKRPATGHELDDQHDDGCQKNQVNEISDGIDVDESQQSQNQEHDKDGPEHMFSFELVYFASFPAVWLRLNIFVQLGFSLRRGCHYGDSKKLLAARI